MIARGLAPGGSQWSRQQNFVDFASRNRSDYKLTSFYKRCSQLQSTSLDYLLEEANRTISGVDCSEIIRKLCVITLFA